ncbi:hypothetical protein [Actinoplanes sp. NPDC026623]|uniref:hypothetical protein n=1 Tax=Actinoplanes sp. NPDC026623 TaxID=3155610 RepID=UPI0033DBD1E9
MSGIEGVEPALHVASYSKTVDLLGRVGHGRPGGLTVPPGGSSPVRAAPALPPRCPTALPDRAARPRCPTALPHRADGIAAGDPVADSIP